MTRQPSRRAFTALLGGAGATTLLAQRTARAQPPMPAIGFLGPTSPDTSPYQVRGLRQGLKEAGYQEGENVAIVYRWAQNQLDRLPALAADLARRRVTAIVAAGPPAAFAAKAATETIPIVFAMGLDPVGLGLVGSLARPSRNLTGVNFFATELAAKRLNLLRELVPGAVRIAVLVNPANAVTTETNLREAEAAAQSMGLQIRVLNSNTSREIEAAFATFENARPEALFVSSGPFFTSRRVQLVHWATRLAVPAVFANREFTDIGGLMSYGANLADAYRQVGVYAGRILKGAKPADLPVVQSTNFELVINGATARMLGLTVPPSLLAIADEVIE